MLLDLIFDLKTFVKSILKALKWSCQDLNLGPPPYQSGALNQAELQDHHSQLTNLIYKSFYPEI
jgi:hypothetical protein